MKKVLCFLIVSFLLFPAGAGAQEWKPSAEEDAFLDKVEKQSFEFFLKEHHPKSGLVKDKASNIGADSSEIASIAATGFGLSAMCVGAERGWIAKQDAEKYCRKTLKFILLKLYNQQGFFYHFIHWGTGKKTNQTEISSIDTALLIAGALNAGEYFKGTEVERLANEIYERVNFPWMMNGGKTLSMGWFPDKGFDKPRWDQFNEGLLLYLLAIGSPTHPIPAESWKEVKKKIGVYGDKVLIAGPPLFMHQYPQVWMDLRNKNDGFADYFENSRIATLVNREFCIDQSVKFKTYGENVWGLTASISPYGYKAYGAEPGGAVHDGTVAPTAAGSSIVFTPELSFKSLQTMYEKYKDKIWGKYGFSDAFNVDKDWYATEVLGIDQGPLLLMIENFRSELVWQYFMRHPAVQRGLDLMGFRPGTLSLKVPQRPEVLIPRLPRKISVDGNLDDWKWSPSITLDPLKDFELGEIKGNADNSAEICLYWTDKYLYVAAKVLDDSLIMGRSGDKIWKDDCLELYFDFENNGLLWGSPKDFQLGLSPGEWENEGRSWAWFQGYDPASRDLSTLKIRRKVEGYDLEARVDWKFFKIAPQPGQEFQINAALHDADSDASEGKLNHFFLLDGKTGSSILSRAVLQGKKKKAEAPTSTSSQ